MTARTLMAALASLVLGATACADNPILEPDEHVEVDVSFALSAEHLSTLTTLEVEVEVTDPDGVAYTDFESVTAEFLMEGETEWRSVDLTYHDGHYSSDMMFYNSGEYEARVVALPHGSDHSETIYEHADHLDVERIHKEVGEYVVEFESFPGHLHEGDSAEVKFWVMGEGSAPGSMSAMGGMAANIHVTHGDGHSEQHRATEHDMGVYEAMHMFDEAGEAKVMMDFTDDHGEHHEVEFHVPVSDVH